MSNIEKFPGRGAKLIQSQDFESLNQTDRIARLHDQLSLIYHKVFFTGDWGADVIQREQNDKDVRTNIFEYRIVNDQEVLIEELEKFVHAVRNTIPSIIGPEEMMEVRGRREYNRITFVTILTHLLKILKQDIRDINTTELVSAMQCIDTVALQLQDSVPPQKASAKEIIKTQAMSQDNEQVVGDALLEALSKLKDIQSRSLRNSGS